MTDDETDEVWGWCQKSVNAALEAKAWAFEAKYKAKAWAFKAKYNAKAINPEAKAIKCGHEVSRGLDHWHTGVVRKMDTNLCGQHIVWEKNEISIEPRKNRTSTWEWMCVCVCVARNLLCRYDASSACEITNLSCEWRCTCSELLYYINLLIIQVLYYNYKIENTSKWIKIQNTLN